MDTLVSRVAHSNSNTVPLKCLWSLAKVQDQLLGLLLWHCQAGPLPCKFGRQHDRPAIVYINHPTLGIGGDDHKAVVLPWAFIAVW